jgi:hypothetical protein
LFALILQIDGTFDGVAPNAKLAFMDLSTGSNGISGLGAVELYTPGYNAGARVHTNSWGGYYSGAGYYYGQDVDSFLFTHSVCVFCCLLLIKTC